VANTCAVPEVRVKRGMPVVQNDAPPWILCALSCSVTEVIVAVEAEVSTTNVGM
jgi:hypothetical protein